MQVKPKVKLVTYTPNAEQTVATAAKLCYSNSDIEGLFEKQTPESTQKFLDILVGIGHESPVEHISFTFALEGVSRALTHQLVRHRIASFSQQSQRYVKLDQFEYIVPKAIEKLPKAKELFIKEMENDQKAYDELVAIIMEELCQESIENLGCEKLIGKTWVESLKDCNKKEFSKNEKIAIENARYVFPNACGTKIIFTMNARTLLHFFNHRCCERAQDEIREVATMMLELVREVCPTIFKFAGPSCLKKNCPEGAMTCGNIVNIRKKFLKTE